MIAAWKDLCIDAVDVAPMAQFWADVLGLTVEQSGAHTRLVGPTPQHTVWINEVPEPVIVKQRVHLDVYGAGERWALELGASVADRLPRWTVLRDPEGGEFCLFSREEIPAYRAYELIVDCADPEPIARWWSDVFGGVVKTDDDEPGWWVEDIPGLPFESIIFDSVPEPKTVKNRIHWDVTGSVDALVAVGATLLRPPDDEIRWTVLADPEGNEFCAFS